MEEEFTRVAEQVHTPLARTFVAGAVLGILTLLPVPSYSQDPEALGKCAAVENDIARLQCYDSLAASVGGTNDSAPAASSAAVGSWIVQDDTNPIDDTRTVVLALLSASGTNRRGSPIGLLLRCQSGETSLYINWRDYLGSEANVLLRVGDEEASTRRWSLSTDSQATFAPGNNRELIERLLTVDRLVAQVTPYSESPITAVFELAGIQEAILPLRETCEW